MFEACPRCGKDLIEVAPDDCPGKRHHKSGSSKWGEGNGLLRLEIGGGSGVWPTWTNLDPWNGEGQWQREAQDVPWPTPDESVETIHASHVMEHIPAGRPRIVVMNEAWRVLVTGGTFQITVPFLTNDGPVGPAIADPTHVSFWCEESFQYFDGSMFANCDYGIKLWRTIFLEVRGGWEGNWIGVPEK